MKNKFKVGLAVIAVSAMVAPSLALAAVVAGDKLKITDGPGLNPGGAFNIQAYDSTGTIAKDSFQSFCLEVNEDIAFGTNVFKVDKVSTEAVKGGAGGVIPTPYAHDPLDFRTAWLYTQYVTNPTGLNSVGQWSLLSTIQQGTAMQHAIWMIEQEITTFADGALLNGVETALVAAAGAAGWTDYGAVKVLNLSWASNGGPGRPEGTLAQDQLYLAPIPEPETYAMLLAGLGLMGFVARRRKQSAAI